MSPASAPALMPPGPPLDLPALGKSMKKVLIIDDTKEVRFIIAETLNMFGFHSLTAEDGLSGVKTASEQLPDLVICDIHMPNLDGYGTLKAMRENETTAAIPFIFLTGAADKSDMRRGMELGADDYLTKPFTHKELMAAVNTRLDKQAEQQRQSDKKLNELRGNITLALPHELRTPLHGIVGLAHLMMDDYANMPPDEVLESARFIYDSAMRLHRLIENFLVYSQIELLASESKTIDVSSCIEPLDVKDVIPELARKIAVRYKREGDLLLKIEHTCLLIPRDNFVKIVEELTDNAFKFSEPGKPVLIATDAADGTFHFSATDKGRGMSAEQISRIGPHIQFDRKTYEQQGAGLGLFIAKRMTELLDGRLHLESELGAGTIARASFSMPGI